MEDSSEEGYFADSYATFGDRVQAARAGAGLSQQELAHKLGIKLKTVRGWEDDLSEPRANKLQMMAGLLNVSIMWLLTGEGDGVGNPDSEIILEEDVREVIAEMRETRGEITRLTEHLGTLEIRLSKALSHG